MPRAHPAVQRRHGAARPVLAHEVAKGIATTLETAARSDDLVAVGLLRSEDRDAVERPLRLVVAREVRRAGHGPISFTWRAEDDLIVLDGEVIWVVTTNKGWAHLRGTARTVDPAVVIPFRADLYASSAAGGTGPDRVALRFYSVGANPNIASPSHRILGTMPSGSVRLGR